MTISFPSFRPGEEDDAKAAGASADGWDDAGDGRIREVGG